jgi:hypothetical protein
MERIRLCKQYRKLACKKLGFENKVGINFVHHGRRN